jgi:RNA-splicing ligase RtcB
MSIQISQSAETVIKSFNREDQEKVNQIMSLLEDENFRELNKIDLCLEENGYKIWAMTYGPVWVAFHNIKSNDICVDWVTIKSKFRQ